MEAEAPLRVLLVEDHALVRSAIRQALQAPDIDVVGEAANAEDALEMAPSLRPDSLRRPSPDPATRPPSSCA